jgi:hypothetical protein
MIDICLFGVSAGLEIRHMPLGNNVIPKTEDSWIDISTRDIVFEGDAEITMIARRQTSSHVMTWIGLYRPAREIHLNRSGGYYGAGMWLIDSAIPGQVARQLVVSLADQLRDNALLDGRFIKNVTELNLSNFKLPRHTSDILNECSSVKGLGGIIPGSATQAIITDKANTSPILDWAQRSKTAEFFGSVLIVSPERLSPVDEQTSRRSRTFNSIPAAIDFVYAERVRMLFQSEKRAVDKQAEVKSLAQQLASQQTAAQTEISRLTQENGQLRNNIIHMEKKLVSLKPIVRTFSDDTAIYPSRIMHQFRENWLLLIGLMLAALFVVIALFLAWEKYKENKSKQNSQENTTQSMEGTSSSGSSKNTDSKKLDSISTQPKEAPKGMNGVKPDTTPNEQ